MSIDSEKRISIVVSGIGGYGHFYLKTLLDEIPRERYRLVGAVDPKATDTALHEELVALNIPLFDSLEAFYDREQRADLAIIVSPIHCHVPQSCLALEKGSHVLLDKPMATTVQDARRLIDTAASRGLWVMVGYQWSFSEAIRSLKKDIVEGKFGNPLRFRTLCCWPRDDAYYGRNSWAGRRKDDHGAWVLDSPAGNAMAHFLHNLLFLLGHDMEKSAMPVVVTAECYRTHLIENYDTVACRIKTGDAVELLFYASHGTQEEMGPRFMLEFEEALVTFGHPTADIIMTGIKGEATHYGSPDDDHQFLKLFRAIDAVGKPGPLYCGLEAALPQVVAMNGIQESIPDAVTIDCTGLDDALDRCYRNGTLPSETGCDWARPGCPIDLSDYRFFPGGKAP